MDKSLTDRCGFIVGTHHISKLEWCISEVLRKHEWHVITKIRPKALCVRMEMIFSIYSRTNRNISPPKENFDRIGVFENLESILCIAYNTIRLMNQELRILGCNALKSEYRNTSITSIHYIVCRVNQCTIVWSTPIVNKLVLIGCLDATVQTVREEEVLLVVCKMPSDS